MTTAPWLSVVVPVFNGARYLSQALESVLSQIDDQVEILVSEDGSQDGSAALIERYASSSQVIAATGPKLGNWVANSNLAVQRARGRWVTFLHQDDMWLPGRIGSIKRLVKSRTRCFLCVSPTSFIDAHGKKVGTWRLPFHTTADVIQPQSFLERLLVQNFIGMPSPVFRREAFELVHGMDEALWFTADWDLWLKLGALSEVAVDFRASTAFRLHPQSQTMIGAVAHQAMRDQIEAVRARHIGQLVDEKARDAVQRAGRFSSELNGVLAAFVAREPARWRVLLASFAHLGPDGFRRFVRDARFLERSLPRLRAGLASPRV